MLAYFFNTKDMCVEAGILLLTFVYLFWVARPLGFEEVRYYSVDEGYYTGREIRSCHQTSIYLGISLEEQRTTLEAILTHIHFLSFSSLRWCMHEYINTEYIFASLISLGG